MFSPHVLILISVFSSMLFAFSEMITMSLTLPLDLPSSLPFFLPSFLHVLSNRYYVSDVV